MLLSTPLMVVGLALLVAGPRRWSAGRRRWHGGWGCRRSAVDRFARVDGVVLVLLFGVFLYYTILGALRQRAAVDLYVEELHEDVAAQPPQRVWVSVLLTALGLAGSSWAGGGRSTTPCCWRDRRACPRP